MRTDNDSIRPAYPKEAGQLTDIAKRAKAHWGYESKLLATWNEALTITPEMCDGKSLFVIESGSQIAGFGEVQYEEDIAILDDLWIDPNFMGSGFGKRLFNFLAETARTHGAIKMRIESDPHATGFYEHMGARVIGEVRSAANPGRALPLLDLDLA